MRRHLKLHNRYLHTSDILRVFASSDVIKTYSPNTTHHIQLLLQIRFGLKGQAKISSTKLRLLPKINVICD